MKKLILVSFLAVAALMGCSKDRGNDTAAQVPGYCTQNGQNYCTQYNTTQYPYNPCVSGNGMYQGNMYGCAGTNWPSGYNPNWYSYGCPAGYIPVQNGVAGSGMTCVHNIVFQNFNVQNGLYFSANYNWGAGSTGIGPAQGCDTYFPLSCGTANGMRCVSYGTRMGFCTL